MIRSVAELDLQELEKADAAALRRLWAEIKGAAAPKTFTARLMRLAIAWEAQAAVASGETSHTHRAWKRVMRARGENGNDRPTSPTVCHGTRFLKKWGGTIHEVVVEESGGALWNGERYTSLSAVARAITGSNRNGPKFFGLREDVK